jgi:putative hydrolase of the HAD superfamily
LPAVGYSGPVDAFLRYWFEKDSHINATVMDAVRRLSRNPDVELYLATGQEHHRAAYLWDELGFKAHFKDIFYSARLGHLKDALGSISRSTRRSASARTSGRCL